MRVILHVTDGPSQGRQIPIQSGERARFGRSDIADVCFPTDSGMADVHFELECRADDCLIRDLGSDQGTRLNDQPVSEAVVSQGDKILAGQTSIRTEIQGQSGASESSSAEDDASNDEADPRLTAVELCALANLDDESLQLFRPDHTPEEFIRVLTEHQQYADAIALLALYLPRRKAIIWGYLAVEQVFPRDLVTEERAAMDAAKLFLEEPSEEHRRAAMAIAEAGEYATPASCVVAAAGWSAGSMAPAEFDDVPPSPQLTGQVIAAALTMTANESDVAKTPERYEQILKLGQEVLAGTADLETE